MASAINIGESNVVEGAGYASGASFAVSAGS